MPTSSQTPPRADAASHFAPTAIGRAVAINGDVVTFEAESGDLVKNEVAYLVVGATGERLKSEVLRVRGREADMQVFEDTQGARVGDRVECGGQMLSASLGPGLLGQIYDGLQNPLHELAKEHGFFLPRGRYVRPLDPERRWAFTPKVKAGDRVRAGDTLGVVPEGRFQHKIMAPFDAPGELIVRSIESGEFRVNDVVAVVEDARTGAERPLTMAREWPARRPLPESMQKRGLCERLYPSEPLTTTIRVIDTFFPIAKGGTGCVPGPFGAGKTVLQGLVSRYSSADIVVIVACGERAGEVVETITEFPELKDPRTGGSLMDRTVIICNTSSMPVAARESSLYMGLVIAEYYRQMGLDALLIADSTSRWAQAMRETSGRLEEIPGEEAFPAYLDSSIKSVYERAGVMKTRDGSVGTLTMLGTVSPAGGNFEEPVTQSTLSTVKTFLGLSYNRAYRRFFPAIDPLISWSRYLEQLAARFEADSPGWTKLVKRLLELIREGDDIHKMMQVTGEEGVTLEDFVVYRKALFLDLVYLQQDAYDAVDVSTPMERQRSSLLLAAELVDATYAFDDKDAATDFFTRLAGSFKNLNYSAADSPEHARHLEQIRDLAAGYKSADPAK
jgi:V/A-type H+-transporting ATPase subunit A